MRENSVVTDKRNWNLESNKQNYCKGKMTISTTTSPMEREDGYHLQSAKKQRMQPDAHRREFHHQEDLRTS